MDRDTMTFTFTDSNEVVIALWGREDYVQSDYLFLDISINVLLVSN
jgi:hypothetical protein